MSAPRATWALAAALLLAGGASRLGAAEEGLPGGARYQKYCSQCHGEKGDGNGVAAPRLFPKPRDFTAGKFKVRTTPSGALPTDADLMRILKNGMPYTSMPGWSHLPDGELQELLAAVKGFSPDFADPAKAAQALAIPKAPEYSAASAEKGKEVYGRIGCGACHGLVGRGDGQSAPNLTDDWGHPIRPADLTKRWTFRGGSSREDIYRTFTTGMNGTPMPSFAESLSDEERWQLVDYIASLSDRDTPNYAELVQVAWSEEEIDPADLPKARAAFAAAPPAYFSVVGQITEPGRAFHPSANGIEVRALYNRKEIAFLLTWHDMRADKAGSNAPDVAVPPEEDHAGAAGAGAAEPAAEEGFSWGEEEETPAADPNAAADDSGDFWGEESAEAGAATTPGGTGFSDAVAIQLPLALPTGNRKPYFLFGDSLNAVDLWFVDLASGAARRYTAAGSSSITPVEGEDVTAAAAYDQGEWSVILKRPLKASGGVTFTEAQFVPIAFSLWDGGANERGNKRGLTQWKYLYTLPQSTPSPIGPMIRIAAIVLLAELALVAWIRRRHTRQNSQTREVAAHV